MHFYICISEYVPQLHLGGNSIPCCAVEYNYFLILKLNSGMWSYIILYVYWLICGINPKKLFF